MEKIEAQRLVETLRDYSSEAKQVLAYLQEHDYREEAIKWNKNEPPTLFELDHPSLSDLINRLTRYTQTISHNTIENIDRSQRLNKDNIELFVNYLQVDEDICMAAKFYKIEIEPIKHTADKFIELNLLTQARSINNIYQFVLSTRRWYQAQKHNPGTPIEIKLTLNYDEATAQELSQDEGYKLFASLFSKRCNYTTIQKRRLYNGIKELYGKGEDKKVDKVLLSMLLIFRNEPSYDKVFIRLKLVECEERAFESMGRNYITIKSYSDNSLSGNPKIGAIHVKRAKEIIKTALDKSK